MRTVRTLGVVCLGVALAATTAFASHDECPADVVPNGNVQDIDVLVVASDFGCAAACVGDVNGNGVTGAADFAAAVGNFGDCHVEGDANGDGSVDISDLSVIGGDIGLDCSSDVDASGTVDAFDTLIVSLTAAADPDALPIADADVDGDGDVDSFDVTETVADAGLDCNSDVNRDGIVDIDDFDIACIEAGFC